MSDAKKRLRDAVNKGFERKMIKSFDPAVPDGDFTASHLVYSGCGCEAIEHFPDYCPECRIAELETELQHGIGERDNLEARIAELETRLLEAMEWNWLDHDFPLDQWNSNHIFVGKPDECISDAEYEALQQGSGDG